MDAANSSRDRRKLIYDRCTERNIQVGTHGSTHYAIKLAKSPPPSPPICSQVFFVESVCDKDTQIEDNIRVRIGRHSSFGMSDAVLMILSPLGPAKTIGCEGRQAVASRV